MGIGKLGIRATVPTLCMDACVMAAAFFGATTRLPFLVFAAALCECRALLVALDRRPLVVP